ncbi:hypothetical protein [Aestuariivirga sp.]|uniref:hypothetical protein n=1 Tax=Aestuariivirga sp. TaxID=2650926 RepID=UPI003919DB4F
MDATTILAGEAVVQGRGKSGAAGREAADRKTDPKELRRVLRAVKNIARKDGSALWQPVSPGGPIRYDYYQGVLVAAFKDQMPGSIRRLKASKPIAVRTRKVVAAMLTLNKFKLDTDSAASQSVID